MKCKFPFFTKLLFLSKWPAQAITFNVNDLLHCKIVTASNWGVGLFDESKRAWADFFCVFDLMTHEFDKRAQSKLILISTKAIEQWQHRFCFETCHRSSCYKDDSFVNATTGMVAIVLCFWWCLGSEVKEGMDSFGLFVVEKWMIMSKRVV